MAKKPTPKKRKAAAQVAPPPTPAPDPVPTVSTPQPVNGMADVFKTIVNGTEAVADAAMMQRLEQMFGENAPLMQMFLTRMAVEAAGGKVQAMREMVRMMHRMSDPEAIMGSDWAAEGADVAITSILGPFDTKCDSLARRLLLGFTVAGSNITEACRRAGIPRTSHYRLLEEDTRYALAVPQAMKIGDDRRVDRAEAMLDRKVVEGDMSAIKLTLLTKGKGRGYVEKQDDDDEGAHEFFVKLFLKKKAEGKIKDVTPPNQSLSGNGPQLEHRGEQAGGPLPVQSPPRHPKAGSWVEGKLASLAHIHDGKACVDVNAGDAVYKLKLEDVL